MDRRCRVSDCRWSRVWAGTRVHGFTSAINVLLLTFCHLLTGQSSYHATFWLYRLFTIPAYAAGGVLLLKAINATPPHLTPAPWFLAIVYLFDDFAG